MTSGRQNEMLNNFMLSDICRIHFHIRSNAGIMAGNRDVVNQSESSEVENLINILLLFFIFYILSFPAKSLLAGNNRPRTGASEF